MATYCPACDAPMPVAEGGCPSCGADPPPASLGRYRILDRLGMGALAVVYRGRDEELRRDVAIKVPHRRWLSSPQAIELFLAEGRMLAGLDHPGIVPVYDVGRTADGLCYLVVKFFQGSDLQEWLRRGRPSPIQVVDFIAQAAEALDHAHRRGLVHRDVKPSNLLLDGERVVVADFGLALRAEDFGTGPAFVGTVPYMSPEQARREGHRVDARTDIYSLGVVFYESLTGSRPFIAKTQEEVLELIRKREARPPRQLDDTIPPELDRICLKCLAKRLADRHATALDLAEELRQWQREAGRSASPYPVSAEPARVVPHGLRAFGDDDADFFLDLLPGPRNRAGLPEAIAFWKSRLESTDPDRAFSLGLLYGPSGCGKSSLIRAGLLPRLAGHVTTLYVEATPDRTEMTLRKSLARRFPALSSEMTLPAALEALRGGKGIEPGRKLVLILDQFEQWLHAHPQDRQAELVQALRQCDGVRVQCLLLVRDDFWLAVSRFLREVEVPLREGENAGLADLFDPSHARKVLAEFGRAYGRLPENLVLSSEQDRFLNLAVGGLAEGGRVVPVRLALFAEMVKNRAWTPASFREVGGAEGVGVAFLEEAFGPSAPAGHRVHDKAARAVLRKLLPAPGVDLKGRVRTREELLAASGYEKRPADFDDLLRVLDRELRLLTPTAPEPAETDGPVISPGYQLAHDFLVSATRDWLAAKDSETPAGRAERRLAEYAVSWNGRPADRRLPGWWEWLGIRFFTRSRDWDEPQRRMMARATRYHLFHAGMALLAVALIAWCTHWIRDEWLAAPAEPTATEGRK